jgi:hypothetical protein
MIKAIKATAISLFALIILGPFLQERLHPFKYKSLTENRLMKPRPTDWPTLFESGMSFAKRYEEYFNDNYGLRDLLIRTKNQLDYLLFHKAEEVVVGPDNWLFYKSVVEHEEIDIERTPPQDWERMFACLLNLNRVLAARGMTLVIMPCPMKNSIYPEMLPASAPRRPKPTGLERYRKFLMDHPEIVMVDTVPLLMKLKESFQVYHKTDFHWTDPAGAHMAKALVNKLGNLSGMGDLWNLPIKIKIEKISAGGENDSMGLLWPIREDSLNLESFWSAEGVGEYVEGHNANEWTYHTKSGDHDRLLPCTVMFGDSYGDAFLRAGFLSYFSEFHKFYNWEFPKKYASIPKGTRYVILQHIEPFLRPLFNPDFWPDEIKAK